MIEPKEQKNMIRASIYMERDLYKKLVDIKHKTDKSVSQIMIEMILYYLAKEDNNAK